MIGPVESSSNVPSSTATAMATSSSEVREAGSNIFKPARNCLCTLWPDENSGKFDISQRG
jgi:hypothetical protein